METKKKRVVIADRRQDMLEGVRSLLQSVFEVVVMVADEQSLLEAIFNIKPDLVIADFSLPVKGEDDIVSLLKHQCADIKFIILSVHDENTVVKQCLDAGAAGFVLKQSAINELIPAIEEVLQDRTYVSPAVSI
jgi:DNA-binding NarL/FixJ family response regulator